MDKNTEVTEIIWGINDMNSAWEDASDAIYEKVQQKIDQLGVNKNSYETKFKLLNIADMADQMKNCPACMAGKYCAEH